MNQTLSEHRFPRPTIRRITARLVGLGLIVTITAIIGQLVLALVIGPLLCGTAFFTAMLLIALLQRTVLHPEITVTDNGLRLQPILWQAQSVPWSALAGITDHPLVFNDDAMGRLLYGKRYRRREGLVVLVRPEAGLSPIYRLIGGLAGAGNTPAFAISSTTHTDYETLVSAIRAHLPDSTPA